MITQAEKYTILTLARKGYTKTKIAELLGLSRTTVTKYIKRDRELRESLEQAEVGSVEYHLITEEIVGEPVYKGKYKERKKLKYTQEIDDRIEEIMEDERRKDKTYGPGHKLQRTAKQIYEMLIEEGFDISYPTICKAVKKKRNKRRETFIKQEYDYGERVEFDFGERKITIGGEVRKVYLAVMTSPASKYRDYYVYLNSKTAVFLDAQVRFFERVGGVYESVVYDNMKNVVKRFVGKNERELTRSVLNLAGFYRFDIVLTNPYHGNEKGSVEASVKAVSQELFAKRDTFDSFEEVVDYVRESKNWINKDCKIEEEKKCLRPNRGNYEVGIIEEKRVNKYAFVRVDHNDYSVPEEYNGALVTAKLYPLSVEFFYRGRLIAKHKRLEGENKTSVLLEHYYNTMLRKPGAIQHSLALKQAPQLRLLFEKYYTNNPKQFLEILIDNKDLCDVDELCALLSSGQIIEKDQSLLEERSKNQLTEVVSLFGGNNEY